MYFANIDVKINVTIHAIADWSAKLSPNTESEGGYYYTHLGVIPHLSPIAV